MSGNLALKSMPQQRPLHDAPNGTTCAVSRIIFLEVAEPSVHDVLSPVADASHQVTRRIGA